MKFPADSVGTSKVVLKVNEQCGSSSPPQPPGLINWQAPLYIDRARHHLISALHPIYVYICEHVIYKVYAIFAVIFEHCASLLIYVL